MKRDALLVTLDKLPVKYKHWPPTSVAAIRKLVETLKCAMPLYDQYTAWYSIYSDIIQEFFVLLMVTELRDDREVSWPKFGRAMDEYQLRTTRKIERICKLKKIPVPTHAPDMSKKISPTAWECLLEDE